MSPVKPMWLPASEKLVKSHVSAMIVIAESVEMPRSAERRATASAKVSLEAICSILLPVSASWVSRMK